MLLVCEQVSFCYDPPTPRQQRQGLKAEYVLSDISFTLDKGESLAFTGPTGSGKSTLVHLICRLLQPTSGSITWSGTNTAGSASATAMRGRLGVALQYPERQLFATTVFDDIAFGPRKAGLSESSVKERVFAALDQVELPAGLASCSPFTLSGGEQRRVALAGILALSPDVLILDEPTAGLDPQTHNSFLRLLLNLREQGMTIVFTSHDMDDIALLAHTVLVLSRAACTFLGTPEELFLKHANELAEQGLALPRALQCANELRAAGIPLAPKLYSLETLADELTRILLPDQHTAHYERNES